MKFLVFATDLPPLPGTPTSGTALRTWGIAEGLRAAGHHVLFAPPKQALQGFLSRCPQSSAFRDPTTIEFVQLEELRRLAFDPSNQNDLIQREQPDVILCGHWPAMMLQRKPAQPLVLDLAGPHLLERHYQKSADQTAAVLVKLGIIATADLFIVSGPSQKEYFRSFLQRAGVPDIDERWVNIPMPLSPVQPHHETASADYPHFIFGGVFLPWQDPTHALSFVADEISRRGTGRLTLIGGKHPNYDVSSETYKSLFARLEKLSFVTVRPMMPYESLCSELLKADVAIDLMSWNIERQLAVTIRSTTYLWSGLPVIYNDYADLGRDIARFDAGWTIPPDDDNALSAVLREVYVNRELVIQRGRNASKLAAQLFSWHHSAQALVSAISSLHQLPAPVVDILIDAPENADFTLGPNSSIEQQFLSRSDGLAFVELRIATHGAIPKCDLSVEVAKCLDGQYFPVAQSHFPAEVLVDNGWIRVSLPTQSDSAGTQYRLRATSDDASLALWAARYQPYPLAPIVWNGQERPSASLCIRTGGLS